MDKPDLAVKKKGVVLTMDALFALALLLISSILIIMLLARPSAQQPPGSQAAGDMMDVLKSLRMEDLGGNPRYPYANYVIDNNLTSGFNQTVIEAIADLYMSNLNDEAWYLSNEMLEPAIPNDYGIGLLIAKNGTNCYDCQDCNGAASNFSCVFSSPRGAGDTYVSVGRHFMYYNNVTREIRLVIHK